MVRFVPVSCSKIITSIDDLIRAYDHDQIIIGYSGGIDSTVLLHACYQLDLPITAVHINHQVNPYADDWQRHCKGFAESLSCQFIAHSLPSCPKGHSFEAWASHARMQHFEQEMTKHQKPLLLLGHHRNDQAETFLLQALRGTSLAGLAAMPKAKMLEHGIVLRPLLDLSREMLEAYITQYQLEWVEDDSNLSSVYLRNHIRHQVIPQLPPSASKTLARTAQLCAENLDAMQYFLAQTLSSVQMDSQSLSLQKLNALPSAVIGLLLNHWLKQFGYTLNFSQNKQLQRMIAEHRTSTQLKLDNATIVISREYVRLHNNQALASDHHTIMTWLAHYPLVELDQDQLIITERHSGDRCRYPKRHKKNKLKVLLQELNIDQYQRNTIKIVRYNNEIVAVYPLFVCPEFLNERN